LLKIINENDVEESVSRELPYIKVEKVTALPN
jgi:hypothetical protein